MGEWIFFSVGVSLVSNTLLQNGIVELKVIDLFIRIMESTEYIDVKVSEREREKEKKWID